MPRDASTKARGFSYQRQYGIYLFLVNLNSVEKKYIIEEGNVNELEYEDITLLSNDGCVYETCQIKYHVDIMRFNRSNGDLFKTLRNENNFNIYHTSFIVSNNGHTYDDTLIKWNNFTSIEKYDNIMNLWKDDTSTVSEYRTCYKLYNDIDKDIILNYLDKLQIIEGYSYTELIANINNLICQIFNVNDEKLMYYIKYRIFELFDNNWFGNNLPLNILENVDLIKKSLDDYSEIAQSSILLNAIENKIKQYAELEQCEKYNLNQLGDNLLIEVQNFNEIYNNNLNFDELLKLLNSLRIFYLKYENDKIKQMYDNLKREKLCELIFVRGHKNDVPKCDYKKFISSIAYYYRHSILNKINLNKSGIKKYLV